MAEATEVALIKRLLSVFGTPATDDVAGFLSEYRNLVKGFGPNVQQLAGDRLIRNGGLQWPSPKMCVDACADAQERMAADAASAAAGKPAPKMPWEVHREQAKQWAAHYMRSNPLGQQARAEGWGHQLELYVMSYARQGYATNQRLPDMATWKPSADVIRSYRGARA